MFRVAIGYTYIARLFVIVNTGDILESDTLLQSAIIATARNEARSGAIDCNMPAVGCNGQVIILMTLCHLLHRPERPANARPAA